MTRKEEQFRPGGTAQSTGSNAGWNPLLWSLCFSVPVLLWSAACWNSNIAKAERRLSVGDYDQAIKLAISELKAGGESDRAFAVAGAATKSLSNIPQAKAFYEQVSTRNPELFGIADFELGQIAVVAGRVSEAETRLARRMRTRYDHLEARTVLFKLLILERRSWEAYNLAFGLLGSGTATTDNLLFMADRRSELQFESQFVEHSLKAVPSDPMPRLARARRLWIDGVADDAIREINLVLRQYPECLEAHAVLALALAESGRSSEFILACGKLPPEATTQPDIWLSKGIWAETNGQAREAARCYWEAVKLDVTLVTASYRLSQVLQRLQQTNESRIFAEWSEKSESVAKDLIAFNHGIEYEKLPSIVNRLKELGRYWEAAGWCQIAIQDRSATAWWARRELAGLSLYLRPDLVCDPARNPALRFDLSSYTLPELKRPQESQPTGTSPDQPIAKIAFSDDSTQLGIDFTYWNGASHDGMESIPEMNGGGIAVLDYDSDHWPDLFFNQGGRLPPEPFEGSETDRLYRNRAAENFGDFSRCFEDVSGVAGIRDIGYGQGCTVGDFDNDGFSDLYVGNIGPNQFYRNNGDGTFSDVTSLTGTAAGGWTSSSVVADFNGDGLPDLYVVTYLEGENVFNKCKMGVGSHCGPKFCSAEPDRFYLNLGDGRFQELSESCGLKAPNGKGLGVVAADFHGGGRLSLFVANDATPNFYFQNETERPDVLRFSEQGLPIGLAVDFQGKAKSCMGVAAGDYNHDGRLDLFVTNFYRESNDMYTQHANGTFQDMTRESKLHQPSILEVGWGTQFIDADLDGNPDLIVANGHVHNELLPEIPYEMQPQFFRNRGDGTFAEIPRADVGTFFLKKTLGRSLARLDWNRDGLEDACILHLTDPVALLTNATTGAGHSIGFRLIAVDSARDAIGTRIKATVGSRILTAQLTAGDGFQASNERRIEFGLGNHEFPSNVEVIWPSGRQQQFSQIRGDREWILIENRAPIELRQYR